MIQVIKKQKGLGDTVKFLTDITGISYAVNKAVEHGLISPCNCSEKQESLNEQFPYGRKD